MSLHSLLRESDGKPSREQLLEAFDGNLCRYTGHNPLIDPAGTYINEENETKHGCCVGCGVNRGGCKAQKPDF